MPWSIGLLLTGNGDHGMLVFGVIGLLILPGGRQLRFKAGRKRQKAFMAQLPDTLQLLSSTLKAGYSFLQGVEAVSQEVEDPMGGELRRIVTEAQLGRPLEDAMDASAERMDSPDFAWAVMAVKIQREVGGNLSELLLTVAETMTERERLRRDVATLTAEGKMSAIVLGALPILLGLAMWAINPEYINTLLRATTLGQILFGLSIFGALTGFALDEEDHQHRDLRPIVFELSPHNRSRPDRWWRRPRRLGRSRPRPTRSRWFATRCGPARRLRGRQSIRDQELLEPARRARAAAGARCAHQPRSPVHAGGLRRQRAPQVRVVGSTRTPTSIDRFLAIRVVTVVLVPVSPSGCSTSANPLNLGGTTQLGVTALVVHGAHHGARRTAQPGKVEDRQKLDPARACPTSSTCW